VAIAKALASAGSHVVLTARDPNKLDRLAEDIQKSCNVPLPPTVCADLLKDDAAASIVQTVSQKQIRIDDLVLACGPFPRTPFETLSRDELQRTLTVHAIQPLLLAQALAGDLSRAQGAVVALGDAGVMRPYTNHVAYITAKGALLAGLRALAVELAPDVRVNVVALGIVADPEADEDPLRTHRLATRSPLNRFGTPEEVVHAVMALLDATWATGEVWGIGR
jgi:pteridine reductase